MGNGTTSFDLVGDERCICYLLTAPNVRGGHAAGLPKPPCPHRRRHPGGDRRILTRASDRNPRPEPAPLLMPRHRGSPWRTQLGSSCPVRTPPPCHHRKPFQRGVATTG